MQVLKQSFPVHFCYEVYFTTNLFDPDNKTFIQALQKTPQSTPSKMLVIVDEGVLKSYPALYNQIISYANTYKEFIHLCAEPLIFPGGEYVKNNQQFVDKIYQQINDNNICRHSYVVAIGGGALLDMVGYAAATAHRGIRHIRVPTTILAQADSGVGVKNAINYFYKKNFLGTFAPPYAIFNDSRFLSSLDSRDWLSGIAEAIKVSLIKDVQFFSFIQQHVYHLTHKRDIDVMVKLIHRCAELHMNHIGQGGDPFEMGSSRPLDFGHWAAHKLEQFTHHRLRHGEAVAIGVALDTTYSYLAGFLPKEDWQQILTLFNDLGFCLYVTELSQHADQPHHAESIFKGLKEFQEHLGGELTLMMLQKLGEGKEVHEVDIALFQEAIRILKHFSETSSAPSLRVISQ